MFYDDESGGDGDAMNPLLHFRSSDFVCEGFKFNGHLVRTVCLFVPFQL